MGEVDKAAVRPLTHGAEQRPDVADAPKGGGRPERKAPKAGIASGEHTTWSKAPAVDDACRKIPPAKLKPLLAKVNAAVQERNGANDGPAAVKAEKVIHDLVFDDLPKNQPVSGHLRSVSDPDAARKLDACISSHFDGIGGVYLRDKIRDAQYTRVVSGVVRLNADIKEGCDSAKGKEHAKLRSAIIADARDFVVGPRADEKDLDAAAVKAKRLHRLGELVEDKLGELEGLDQQLFADLVRQCAEGIPVSREDAPSLQFMLSKHKGEPIYQWLDTLKEPQ